MHVCVADEHRGVVPPQSALPRQPTQTPPPPDVSHSGVAAPQRLVSVVVHAAQAPDGRHTGRVGSQSAPDRQRRHVCKPVSQTGRVPEQSELATHSTQESVVVSQALCAAAHAPGLPAAQATQVPPEHTGVAPPHSPSAVQLRHVWVAPSQTGVAPEQSAAATHVTHVPLGLSQSGVVPVHAAVFVAEHAPHEPEGWHAGVAPPQSPSPTQPRHACVVPSHTGDVAVVHAAPERQPTHVPVGASHTGVAPVHAVALVLEHAPHAPVGSHAGVAPPHSPSPEQPRHVCVVVSQVGFVPPQFAFDVQPTQTPAAASHTEVAPAHRRVFVAEHAPQVPFG
jgi:hypothetical protein